MSYLDQITVGSNTYELKSSSIPSGTIANTSTSTVFTATVNGVYSLYDGVRIFLRNETITSASGCTLNINNLGAKPIYDAKTNSAITNNFKINTSATFIYNSTQISGGCWLLDGSENEVYYGTTTPTDPNIKFWIDPSGTADSIPQPATNTPQDLGVANVGSSTKYARQDHVHSMPSNIDVGVDFRVYDSVADLGLTVGSATITEVWSALSANEILICEANNFTTSTGGVPSTLGAVEIIHSFNGRGSITFYGKEAGNADYRMYLNSSNVPTEDWVRMARVLDLGTFTGTAKSFTLPAAGNYLIGTTHASSATSVGIWIYSTSGSTFFNMAGGSTITLTGNGTSFTAESGGATVGLYAIRLR